MQNLVSLNSITNPILSADACLVVFSIVMRKNFYQDLNHCRTEGCNIFVWVKSIVMSRQQGCYWEKRSFVSEGKLWQPLYL